MSKRFLGSTAGRTLIGAASVLALVAATGPLAVGASGDNTGTAIVAPADTQVAKNDRWAVIDADGSFARGKGVVSTATLGTGAYEVIFNKNVRGCVYTATIGLSGDSGTSAPGFITTVGRVTDLNGVFISTDDVTGASTNLGFHLHVGC